MVGWLLVSKCIIPKFLVAALYSLLSLFLAKLVFVVKGIDKMV